MPAQQLPMGFWQRVRQIASDEVRKFARSGFLNSASVSEGDFTIKGGGSLRVKDGGDVVVDPDGEVRSSDFAAGSAGWRLEDGAAEFNDVILRGVLVGLDTPVLQQTARASASDFNLTTTMTEKAAVDVIVPESCTRLRAMVFGRMYVVNANNSGGADGTGTDALYVQAGVAGNYSTATPTGISGSNGFATTNGFESFDLDGLTPGNTVRINARGASAFASIAANPTDYISVVASLTWLR